MEKFTEPTDEATKAKNDAYAQSLLKMVNAEYARKQVDKPRPQHFISKKMLIILIVSIILTIIAGVAVSTATKKTQTPTTDLVNGVQSTNQLQSH